MDYQHTSFASRTVSAVYMRLPCVIRATILKPAGSHAIRSARYLSKRDYFLQIITTYKSNNQPARLINASNNCADKSAI